ncbi:MAG TPA: hypothetical protein VJK02_12685, partial [Anaerolineales bacterium]|nr:hypothetical protein [Anaerolineales bacterium]
PHILVPVTLFLALVQLFFVPGKEAWGQGATFLLASLAYGLLAGQRQAFLTALVSVACSIGAVGFALNALALPGPWYPAAAACGSLAYLLIGSWMDRGVAPDASLRRSYIRANYGVGFALLTVAIPYGLITLFLDVWAAVAALVVSSVVLAACAFRFRRPTLVLFAASLFILPFSAAIRQWLWGLNVDQADAWLAAAWAGLALSYLGVGALLRTLSRFAQWLHLVAHGLAAGLLMILLFNWALTLDHWFSGPTLVALGGAILLYLASAVIHDLGQHPGLSSLLVKLPSQIGRPLFVWPIAGLLPVWIAVAWEGSPLPTPWLGSSLAGLALTYVPLGRLLSKRHSAYKMPFHVLAYLLLAAGAGLSWSSRPAATTSLYLAVAAFTLLVMTYRRALEVTLAGLALIPSFHFSLELLRLTPNAYSLAYAFLASVGYVPLGRLLERFGLGQRTARPMYVIGYSVSVVALLASLLGRFGAYLTVMPWVGVAVPLVVTGLFIYGARAFSRSSFAWAASLVILVAFGQSLTLLRVDSEYDAAAWVGFAFAYLLIGRLTVRSGSKTWQRLFGRPLASGAVGLVVFGLFLTGSRTLAAFVGNRLEDYLAPLLAQSLAVGVMVLSAVVYRSRRWAFFEPWLAFFPVTLFFLGYGEPVIGRSLRTPDFGVVWSVLAIMHVFIATWVDRAKVRYSHDLYSGGYLLGLFALFWSTPSRTANLYSLAVILASALWSHGLVHAGRHRSFDDLLHSIPALREPGTTAHRSVRVIFLFFAVYMFPVWLLQLLTLSGVGLAWRGLALTLLAPIYVALGLAASPVKGEYAWPFYSAGYALTAVGAMVAFDQEGLAIYVLALNAVVYAVSAAIFRQAFWLYLTAATVPCVALLLLHYNWALNPRPVALVFIGLAFLYFLVGQGLERLQRAPREAGTGVDPFALAFYAPGYLLSAIAVAVSSGGKSLATQVFSAAVILYAFSAWAFREPVFLYPAAWLLPVPYYLVMTQTIVPPGWYGLGWLPLILGYIALGRSVFRRASSFSEGVRPLRMVLTGSAMPFYLAAYTLVIGMVVISRRDPFVLTLALVAASAIYFGSAALFRRPAWLYPGLLAAHLALLAALTIHPTGQPVQYASLPFLGMTWLVALIGHAFKRWSQPATSTQSDKSIFILGRWKLHLEGVATPGLRLTPPWARPFLIVAGVDILVWQLLALLGLETAVLFATGIMLLLGVLSFLWLDRTLVYGTLAFFMLALAHRLAWAGLPWSDAFVAVSATGFGLYLLGRLADLLVGRGAGSKALEHWPRPLTHAAIGLTGLAVVATVPTVAVHQTATAFALGCAGALYLAVAYRGRYYRLGYAAMALLESAWVLLLVVRDVNEPQSYAIPGGLYLAAVGFLERRRQRSLFAVAIESFGLALLLVTSFVQSLNGGAEGLPYFVLLLLEAFLVIWWGAGRRLKVPFFIGLGASALNIAGQVVVLFAGGTSDTRWIIIGGAGLIIVAMGVFVERQRERILVRAQEWREALDGWA